MNLIVSAITMVDLTNKEAKRIYFSPDKNLLTSEHNHLGKSVIMKSIYYTLGAEVYYPHPIKRLNLLTYIDFLLDRCQYRIARLKNTFVLYCDGSFCGRFPSVNEFENELSKLFGLEINLVGKDQEGTIVKCPPAFYYMPYYIDQENGWSANSFSFDRMTQFDMLQRKSSYFFHLGVLDSRYVEISKRQKTNSRQINTLKTETERYRTVIEILQAGLNAVQMSFDTVSLERAIALRQREIKQLLDEISKVRSDLLEAGDQLVQVLHEKEVLSKYIKKKIPQTESSANETIECPRCGMVFEQALRQRLEKAYLLESLHDDYTTVSGHQAQLERKVTKLQKKFDDKQHTLVDYEKSLVSDRESYNAYLGNLGKLLIGLDIPSDQIKENSEPGSALVASGAYGPRCKVAQVLAFIETQHLIAPNLITFPVVIDSPNVLEQDNEHLDTVIRSLLMWNKTGNQIIVASIQGRDIAAKIDGVNIITLTDPQNHLFCSSEYAMYEAEIAEIFTQF